MAETIRIEDMDLSDAEKKLIVRALNDKAFRDELQTQLSGELSDAELEGVAGGVGQPFASGVFGQVTRTQVTRALDMVGYIQRRMHAGANVLCTGGGPCGVA